MDSTTEASTTEFESPQEASQGGFQINWIVIAELIVGAVALIVMAAYLGFKLRAARAAAAVAAASSGTGIERGEGKEAFDVTLEEARAQLRASEAFDPKPESLAMPPPAYGHEAASVKRSSSSGSVTKPPSYKEPSSL